MRARDFIIEQRWYRGISDSEAKLISQGELPKASSVPVPYDIEAVKHLGLSDAEAENLQQELEGKQVINKGLKSIHVARIKSQAAGLLQSTDWYVIRNAESGTAIPANVSTYRASVRSKSNDMEALINAVSSVEQLAALYVYDKDTQSRPLGDFPRL